MKFLIVLTDDCIGLAEILPNLQNRGHEVAVLLLEDAVYLADKGNTDDCMLGASNVDLYICKDHLSERGLDGRLAVAGESVDYPTIVNLIMERYDRVISL